MIPNQSPSPGNGGMVQLALAGNVSMFVLGGYPPVIIRPDLESYIKYKQQLCSIVL